MTKGINMAEGIFRVSSMEEQVDPGNPIHVMPFRDPGLEQVGTT
jgi:hypothetical protein